MVFVRIITCVAVLAFVAAGVGCEQAEKAAEGAETAAEKTTAAAGDAVKGMSAEMEKATADLMQRAEKAAASLDGEAKALYKTVSDQLTAKQGELTKLKNKIAEMAPKDLLSGDGKAMKDTAAKLTSEIGELKTKLENLIARAG